MLTVEKIGGTSMSRFDELLKTIFFYGNFKKKPYGRIFVVSAYGGVTDLLLEHKKTGTAGIYEHFKNGTGYQDELDTLLIHLKKINKSFEAVGLDTNIADEFITDRIEKTKRYLESMEHVISSGYVAKESITLAARELLASIGESHSAFNSVEILKKQGVSATLVDLSGFYDTITCTINERIHSSFKGLKPQKTIIIATGYTNGTEGIMREFDRGYSEITFSKICAELKPDEAIIHKEFHLSSADPNLVGLDKSIIVGNTNFDVADQLADVGMEAIHPKAAKPIEKALIPLRLKNAFDPGHNGTLITKNYISKDSRVEVITGTDKVVLVEVFDPEMVGEAGFDFKIAKILNDHNVSYILKTTNANTITHILWEKDATASLLGELRKYFDSIVVKECAMVCAIGSNIAKPGILAKAAQALADNNININCVSQTMRQVNMQFVINRAKYKEAIICLNNELCIQ